MSYSGNTGSSVVALVGIGTSLMGTSGSLVEVSLMVFEVVNTGLTVLLEVDVVDFAVVSTGRILSEPISDIENFRSKTSDAQILRTFRS